MARVKVKTRARKKARVKENHVPLRASVPVKSVSFASTTFIPYIELLGERSSITSTLTDMAYVSSPCLKKRDAAGLIGKAGLGWGATGANGDVTTPPQLYCRET